MTNLSGANLNNGAAVGPQGEGRESPGSFPTYPTYRSSGIEWLGVVPEHWALGSLKHLAWIRNGRDYKDVESPDGEYPVIGSGGQFANATQYLYDGESVLLGRKGTIDKPLYIHGRFWTVDTMFYTEVGSGASAKFLYYNALTIPFQYYSTSTALPSMTQGDLLNHPCVIPALEEQTQIARFLDHETARIDALIEEQQRLIELLKEKRQAVISHAVTKGLDPAVPMKDSGVEWLGEVPAHWHVKKLKNVTRQIIDGAHFTPTYVDEGVPFIRVTDIQTQDLDLDSIKRIPKGEHCELIKRCNPEKGDVLLSKNGTIGITKIIDWDFEFSIFVSLCLLKPAQNITSKYLLNVLSGNYAVEQFKDSGQKTSVTNLHLERIREIFIVLPSKAEQLSISTFIEHKTAELDLLISEAMQGNSFLQERRSALISAAVTGKIDVRGWQPPASTPIPELEKEAV
ncbi:restriction endonuclease subunit S [Stutzerimonas stutzeri]|uniref:restriction endonuclease subunit S n=1 Tax=Stutzerimonas stutzeri TaxID=316 RepID=UPI0037D82E34